jgi:transglutaminase-like putative cysteine protease
MTLVSAVVGAVVFCLTPRFGGLDLSWLSGRGGPWRDSSAALRRTVGYSDQVRLGELGSVMEDIQRVMTLRLVRPDTGEQYRADGQLFLRGAVLNQYQDGRWAYRGDGESVLPRRILDRPGEPPPDVVRQEIRLDPLDHQELFCLWPFQLVSDDDRLQFHRDLQRLQRPGTLRQRRFSYELATTALADGRQLEIAPAEGRIDVQTLLQWPEAALPRLAALARQWDRESGIAASNPLGRAQALERRLRNSPRFRYRLGDEQRDSRLDPIEDFIANDPRGHCEHFASALALMLRSQGLPARLVVGYKTDEYNSLEQRYWVRQSHAHTWVEAYIPPAAIPAAIRQPGTGSDWSQGAWLRLDPTPSDLAELTWAEYVKATLRKWQISIRTAWLQHVVQMSGARQESLFYRPLIQALRDAARRIAGGNGGGGASAGGRGVADSPWSWMNSPLVLASGSILAGSTLLLLLALRHRRRTVGRRDPRSARVEPRTGPSRGAIEFYRRWEQALDQWGLRRRPAQTPFEFAQEAGRQLAEAVEQPQLRSAALQLVEVFYGVRFGQWELDARAAARAAEALASFQHAALP